MTPFTTFLTQIPSLATLHRDELANYFIYYLTGEEDSATTPQQVADCFSRAEVRPYVDVRHYMKNAVKPQKGRPPLLIRTKTGYRLERSERARILATLQGEPFHLEGDSALRGLVGKIAASNEKAFLVEAIKCYEVKAYRAAIIMVWLLTIDHLHNLILKHHLAGFNAELAKNRDKRVKVDIVNALDDFADIPEGKLIEFLRAAHIVSNDVRKILDVKLGIRNSYAHPSSISLSPAKAAEFITDLTDNVILKYAL
jgi:hypothetical protein